MRTLAIGDIHGCNTALVNLLKQVRPAPTDRIILLGDYIDRGPASRHVIETLLELRMSCSPIFLRGNHEVMILDARENPLRENFWQSCGGLETLCSYGADGRSDWVAALPDTHWKFFQDTQRFFETDTHIFAHAYVDHELDMSEQPDWLLYWEYFDGMQPHKSKKRIICGHTPQPSGVPQDAGFAVCIDTAAVKGGWLTCLDADSGTYCQANENGQTRRGSL